jgi:hypothetical protein
MSNVGLLQLGANADSRYWCRPSRATGGRAGLPLSVRSERARAVPDPRSSSVPTPLHAFASPKRRKKTKKCLSICLVKSTTTCKTSKFHGKLTYFFVRQAQQLFKAYLIWGELYKDFVRHASQYNSKSVDLRVEERKKEVTYELSLSLSECKSSWIGHVGGEVVELAERVVGPHSHVSLPPSLPLSLSLSLVVKLCYVFLC